MSFSQILLVGLSSFIALIAAVRLARRRSHPLPLPPGPKPLPFVGNAHRLDTARPWLTYTAWGKEYGNIIYSRLLGIDMIIINSDDVAKELLDKRSTIYSDRPYIPTTRMSGLGFVTGLLPYGETLKQHRRIFHQVLKAETSTTYTDMYFHQAHELVMDLLETRKGATIPIEACERYTGGVTMSMTYGDMTREEREPVLDKAHRFINIVAKITSPEKSALFTAFPFLEKFPMWAFSRDYSLMGRSSKLGDELLNEPFDDVKARMAKGTASPSLVKDFLTQTKVNVNERILKDVALSGYLAGNGTARFTIHIFMLCMVLYPEIQERARAEIDKVVKQDRMPNINDRPALPYIDALVTESLRWYPPAPLGAAHATSKDDVYNGYFIPKGSLIMVNQWSMSRNEDHYTNPDDFDPGRHLDADGQLKDKQTFNHFAFGHGRRICPGRWFATDALWTAMVTMLAVVRIGHAKDENGNKVEFEPQYTPGILVDLKPFPCSIEIANPTREAALQALLAKA